MPGQPETLYKLQKKDLVKAAAVAASAFQQDPFWSALFEGETRTERRAGAFEAPIRYCFKYGEVYAPSENLEGVAAWVPSDFADMTIWRMLWSGSVIAGFKVGVRHMMKMLPVLGTMDADRIKHMKGKLYIHFHMFAVAPEFQGRGLGGKLLRALIERSEQAGAFIYLETQTEDNVRMYEKFGFEVIEQRVVPTLNLPMWELTRKPGK